MSDKQLRIIAWRLNPSFSPEHSLIKLETELSRFGHLILASWLIRSTLTAGKAVRALRLLICGFVVVTLLFSHAFTVEVCYEIVYENQ